MRLLPAIDIHLGQCVRLYKGDFATAAQVAKDPLETARSFEEAGASWIHMVDLDGAKDGKRVNSKIFLQVVNETGLKVELGGGIRDMESVEYYLSHGVERVILGSAAITNEDFVRQALGRYGSKIAIGIDAKDEMAMAQGWLESGKVHYLELARKMESIGAEYIIYTDISKDGTLQGPNFKQLNAINSAVSCNIIASGGIHCIEDLQRLKKENFYGAICGKSLYEGKIDLARAVREIEG